VSKRPKRRKKEKWFGKMKRRKKKKKRTFMAEAIGVEGVEGVGDGCGGTSMPKNSFCSKGYKYLV
jgi:hypothetical protein